jgi:hypothetical protein
MHFRGATACPPLQPTAIASHFAGADLAYCSTAEQTIELLLGDAVALARALYQALAIDDRDVATSIADEAGGQELLREQKLTDCMLSCVINSQRQHRCCRE